MYKRQALARPDDPLPEEPYTTDTLRQEALTRGFLWSSYIWGEQRVQVYPMNPIYRSEDAVEVWACLLYTSQPQAATTAWGLRLLALRIICRDFLSLTAVTEQVLMM